MVCKPLPSLYFQGESIRLLDRPPLRLRTGLILNRHIVASSFAVVPAFALDIESPVQASVNRYHNCTSLESLLAVGLAPADQGCVRVIFGAAPESCYLSYALQRAGDAYLTNAVILYDHDALAR